MSYTALIWSYWGFDVEIKLWWKYARFYTFSSAHSNLYIFGHWLLSNDNSKHRYFEENHSNLMFLLSPYISSACFSDKLSRSPNSFHQQAWCATGLNYLAAGSSLPGCLSSLDRCALRIRLPLILWTFPINRYSSSLRTVLWIIIMLNIVFFVVRKQSSDLF